jgi:hypothetical protein
MDLGAPAPRGVKNKKQKQAGQKTTDHYCFYFYYLLRFSTSCRREFKNSGEKLHQKISKHFYKKHREKNSGVARGAQEGATAPAHEIRSRGSNSVAIG